MPARRARPNPIPFTLFRERRELLGVSAEEAAIRLGITPDRYKAIETDTVHMDLAEAIALAHMLGIGPDELGRELEDYLRSVGKIE